LRKKLAFICEKHILDKSLQVSPCRFCNKNHSSSLPFGYNEKIAGSIAKYNDALSACKAAEEKLATLVGMLEQVSTDILDEFLKKIRDAIEAEKKLILAKVEAKEGECRSRLPWPQPI
jgi:hypothetical protein